MAESPDVVTGALRLSGSGTRMMWARGRARHRARPRLGALQSHDLAEAVRRALDAAPCSDRALGRGRLVGPSAERVMFTDLERGLIDDYAVNGRKSIRRVRGALAHLRDTFGFHRALDITTDRVNAYIRQRQESGAANATIQKERRL